MEKTPLISIVMPVYNAAAYLQETVGSLNGQLFRDFELIMVDDCSNDESSKICDDLAVQDNRIRVIHLKKNGGAGNARNVGITAAKGKYLTFLDADDMIEPDLYQCAVDSLKEQDADMVVWGLTEDYYNEKGDLLRSNPISVGNKICRCHKEVIETVIELEKRTLFGYQWNRLYRLSIIRDKQIYFENTPLYEDYFFNMDVIGHITTMNVMDVTKYHYQKRMNQSLTSRYVQDYYQLSERRVCEMYELYQEWDAYDTHVRDILGTIYMRYILSALMRTYDQRANMSRADRVTWLKSVRNGVLYGATAGQGNLNSSAFGIFQKLLNRNCWTMCLAMGYITFLVKEKFPVFFSRKKQN